MEGNVQMENNNFSALLESLPPESYRPSKQLRKIIAGWILAKAPCPVLVIREGKSDYIGQTTSRDLQV